MGKEPAVMQEMQEIWVQFLGQEDPLEEGTATHYSILAWRIPWTEEPGGLQPITPSQSDTTKVTEHACKLLSSHKKQKNKFFC